VNGQSKHGEGRHHHGQAHDDDGPQPTVFSLETLIEFSVLGSPTDVQEALFKFGRTFARALAGHGCRLIGHVKGALETRGCGTLYFSQTTLDGPPKLTGGLSRAVGSCRLTLNAIVFGVDRTVVEACALDAIEGCLGQRAGATAE
jgi:hypothetical protein